MAEPRSDPSAGDRVTSLPPRTDFGARLELVVVAHVAVLAVGAAWALGGNTGWARVALSAWGSLSLLITALALRAGPPMASTRQLHLLWPLAVFDALVLISLFNPNYREVSDGARTWLVEQRDVRWPLLPSTARPEVSLHALWFLNASYLSAFNLLVAVRRRRAIRTLVALLVVNGVILAVFGTLQKLLGATGPFFAPQSSRQSFFFASFLYHNHWGAFALVLCAAAIGLAFHHARRGSSRGFAHSPAPVAALGAVLLAATLPLSGSRSATLLAVPLAVLALAHALSRLRRGAASARTSVAVVLAFGIATVAIYLLAQPVIAHRLAQTREQLSVLATRDAGVGRTVLYRDTWNLAREKLWFGWGMGSYPTAFYSRNTQALSPVDGLPHHYADAHSDWLQSVAEVGLVGTALLALGALVPLLTSLREVLGHPLPRYLLAGCALLLVYATLEFPFGNRAVIILFWTALFAAVQHARLDRVRHGL